MVRRQVRLWREAGFGCVFITNAHPAADDWAAIAEDAALRIRRANVGRDFGAWRDAAAMAVQRFGTPRELLLTNDSVLGPFLPLQPLVDAWRAGGDGFLGFTESLGGGVHLQSYALLGRGKQAVTEILGHLATLKDSRNKRQVVLRGEIGLTQRMLAAGVPCWALFGQERLAAVADAAGVVAVGGAAGAGAHECAGHRCRLGIERCRRIARRLAWSLQPLALGVLVEMQPLRHRR
jgi:lipopolysaccharide biosynthesis protein